jgi:hypothetical protein
VACARPENNKPRDGRKIIGTSATDRDADP